MSQDITKKQHYVWRRYLGAWKNNPSDKDLWTGFINTKGVKKVALMGVAQSSFFYKLEELNDFELRFLKLFNEHLSPCVRQISDVLYTGYVAFTQLKRNIATGLVKMDSDYEHQVKKIETTSIEAVQSHFELMGDDLLKCTSIDDIEKLAPEKEYEFLYYLMVQYLRTKARKDSFVSSLTERSDLMGVGEKCWPYFNFVVAMQMVESFVVKKDYRFVFVKNTSTLPFITGDQPVINSLGHITDENGYAKELELYYPTSPSSALMVSFNPGEKFSEVEVDESFVRAHNQLIANESQLHLFANGEQVLKETLSV